MERKCTARSAFERHVEAFVNAYTAHKDALVREAYAFIVDTCENDLVKASDGCKNLS